MRAVEYNGAAFGERCSPFFVGGSVNATTAVLAVVFLVPAVRACNPGSGGSTTTPPDPDPVDVGYAVETDCPVAETDPVTVDYAYVEDGDLVVGFTYDGGCEDHEFALCWGGDWIKTSPMKVGLTLHHDGNGRWGAGKVMLRAAPAGTGLIAGGPMRAVLEVLGVSDVVAKSKGSSNPYNMVRATIDALKEQSSPRQVANRRGLKVADLVGRRKDGASMGEVPAEG